MLLSRKHADRPTSRISEITAGCILGVLSLFFCLVAAFFVYESLVRGSSESDIILIGLILAPLGLLGVVTAYRLLTGRGRHSDGGLFAPWLLRILGLLFQVGGAAAIFVAGDVAAIVGALPLGIGCFYLANRQQRKIEQLRFPGNDT